jgi:diaminohydroxyphosphoribosylaminopyrimidine deaminase/5-amino-6-(5-phosphoribosylamino)uracil reductase
MPLRHADPDCDQRLMRRALELAGNGLFSTHPNPRVGCVIARDGRVIAEGFHERAGDPHAEVNALTCAGADARGATVYVTLEPCCHHGQTGPCSEALIDAGIGRLVCAMQDPNPAVSGGGLRRLSEAGVVVQCGVLEQEARALNRGFVSRWERRRPLLRAKLAMSLDGRTAVASGESQWITGPRARQDVQRFRAMSDVILTGVDTVIADDPSLTVRPGELPSADRRLPLPDTQPLRVIMDSRLRTPADARILGTGPVLLVTTAPAAAWPGDLATATTGIRQLAAGGDGRVDPGAVLTLLGQRGCNEAWLEAGATLSGAFISAGLVDELVVYCAPCLLGNDARGLCLLPPISRMSERFQLEFIDVERIGADLRILARPHTG